LNGITNQLSNMYFVIWAFAEFVLHIYFG